MNLWFEWVPNMLEHDKMRDLKEPQVLLTHQSEAWVTHCCRLSLSFECTAEGLIMLNIFDETREKLLYVFVSVWKTFFRYLLYVSVSIHGLLMSIQWWSYHAAIRGEYKMLHLLDCQKREGKKRKSIWVIFILKSFHTDALYVIWTPLHPKNKVSLTSGEFYPEFYQL